MRLEWPERVRKENILEITYKNYRDPPVIPPSKLIKFM